MTVADLGYLIQDVPLVEASSLKRLLYQYIAMDERVLKLFRGKFEETLTAQVVLLLKKKGLIEETEIINDSYYQISNLIQGLPAKEVD